MNDDTIASGIDQAQGYLAKLPRELGVPVDESVSDAAIVATEAVGLVIVGGLAIGLLAAALMPRSKKKRLAKRSKKIAALVGELSDALASQTSDAASESRDKLGGLSKSIGETVSEQSQEARKQAGKLASGAADQLNDSGKAIARQLVRLVEKVRS